MFGNIRKALAAPHAMTATLAAAGILMVTMGTRQSLGLFVSPINSASDIGIVAISLALAIGQFSWGLAQPFAGFLSDRYGPAKVLVVDSKGVLHADRAASVDESKKPWCRNTDARTIADALKGADVLLGGERHLAMIPADLTAHREPWPRPVRDGLPALLDRHRT